MKRALSTKNLWEQLPPRMKGAVGHALSLAPLCWVLGRGFCRTRRFLHQSQFWSREEIERYQVDQLRRILTIAYEKTRHWREVFDQAGFHPADMKRTEDIRRLPTMTLPRYETGEAEEKFAAMCTVPPTSRGVDLITSGGSSGKPLAFYIGSGRSGPEYAHLVTSWSRVGFELGDTMAVLRGRYVPADRTGLRHCYDPLLRHHYYSVFHMSDDMMERYLRHIATIGPCWLHVYPSSALALTRFIEQSGIRAPSNILGVLAESENLYEPQRERIQRVFGCRLSSSYGHSEKLIMAAECEHGSDYHVWPTYGYFELLNGDAPVTTPGQQGEIVGTGFINDVMPFIRYRTGDWACYVADRCERCGRNHILIRDIRGHRTQEMLISRDGARIPWTCLNMHDDTYLNVRQLQCYQDTPGKVVIRVVPAPGFSKADEERLLRSLHRRIRDQLDFTIEKTDSIPLTRRGKAVYVEQRIEA